LLLTSSDLMPYTVLGKVASFAGQTLPLAVKCIECG